MDNFNNIYGGGEATPSHDAGSILNTSVAVRFGRGAFDLATLRNVSTDDGKIRFVFNEPSTGSGIVMVGDKLVTSKILDVQPVLNGAGIANKLVVTWIGKKEGDTELTVYENVISLNDSEVVDEKIKEVSTRLLETSTRLNDVSTRLDNVSTRLKDVSVTLVDASVRITDTSANLIDLSTRFADASRLWNSSIERLDTSVNTIEAFIKQTDNLESKTGGAITVVPDNTTHPNGYVTYDISVNVDASTIKIVDNKLSARSYTMVKLDDVSSVYTSQYQLCYVDPETQTNTSVGPTIDIFKDYFVKAADVDKFMFDVNGNEIDDPDINIGDDIDDLQIDVYSEDGHIAPKGKHLSFGHTYLHLAINTKTANPDDPAKEVDQVQDVYLDFTQIFETFKGSRYIDVNNGTVSLNTSTLRTDILDPSFQLHEASILDLDSSVYALETSVYQLESSVNILENRLAVDESSINASIVRLDASVSALEAHIAKTDTSIDTLNSSVNRLENLLSADTSLIDASIKRLDTSVSAIEDSYVTDASLKVPSEETDQFNTLTLTVSKDGETTDVSVDIANSSFYNALNDTIDVLSANDQYLASLLTWETLD